MARKLLLILALGILIGILFGPDFAFLDLSIYWMACSQWIAGHSAYVLPHQSAYVLGWGGFDAGLGQPLAVWSPPFFLVPTCVFGVWDLPTAKSIYVAVTFFALGAFALLIHDSRNLSIERTGYGALLTSVIATALLVPFSPIVELFFYGGMGALPALAFALLLSVKARGIGIWLISLLLFSVKPHPCVLIVLGWFAGTGRTEQRTMLRAFALAIVFLAAPVIIEPSLLSEFLQADLSIPLRYQEYTETLAGFLRGLGFYPIFSAAPGLLIVSLIIFSIHKNKSLFTPEELPWLIVVLSPLSVFLCPYAWGHDYIICAGWAGSLFVFKLHQRAAGRIGIAYLFALNLAAVRPLSGRFEWNISCDFWSFLAFYLYLVLVQERQSTVRFEQQWHSA